MKYWLAGMVLFAAGWVFAQNPPFRGTIFDWPDSFTDEDPSTFTEVTYEGVENRRMNDRRGSGNRDAHVYATTFTDDVDWEIVVNAEFNKTEADELADYYGFKSGQMPAILRAGMRGIDINDGNHPWGGSNPVIIHTIQGESYARMGIVTETLIHESTHAVIDRMWYNSAWQEAVDADGIYLSTYARDNPRSEDHSETWLAWIAVRYKEDRISQNDYETITETIPNRLAFYDAQDVDMHPVGETVGVEQGSYQKIHPSFRLLKNYPNPMRTATTIEYRVRKASPVSLRIMDLKGQVIATLVDEDKSPGTYQIEWKGLNASGVRVSGGTYIYALKSATHNATEKMLVLPR